MTKFTKKQKELVASFAKSVSHYQAFTGWAKTAFMTDDHEGFDKNNSYARFAAKRALHVAREIGLTDEQIKEADCIMFKIATSKPMPKQAA